VPLLAILLSILAAAGLAAAAYVPLRGLGPGRWAPAVCRALALLVLLLLLADPLLPGGRPARPLVLLDASLSMGGAGGQWAAARESAAARGEFRLVGDDSPRGDTTPHRGASRLGPALRAAAVADRPLVIVTDGEVDDAAALDPAAMARAALVVLPRPPLAGAAIAALDGPDRATVGDTLEFSAEIGMFAGPAGELPSDSLQLDVTLAGRVLLRRPVGQASPGRHRIEFALPAAALGAGTHALRMALTPADLEPRDDTRLWLVTVTATPGAVLLARPGDWDARLLHRTLREVAGIPVRGFVHLGEGGWRRMDDLRPASEAEVARAAAGADLLVLKGRTGGRAAASRARGVLRWPSGEEGRAVLAGDWYLGAVTPSPIGGALALPLDSLPPLARMLDTDLPEGGWIAATAQAGRRGTPRAVLSGRIAGGRREVTIHADGFWRWGFRGGLAEQAYRGMVAATVSWLLAAPDTSGGTARPVRPVVQRGQPLRFAWAGDSAAVATTIAFEGDGDSHADTLRFDGEGRAAVWLEPGTWRYRLGSGGGGVVAVEEYSDEWLPRPPALASHAGAATPRGGRLPFRTRWWPYLLVVLALGAEWWWRRRLGLR
jgi:hypothetical protein